MAHEPPLRRGDVAVKNLIRSVVCTTLFLGPVSASADTFFKWKVQSIVDRPREQSPINERLRVDDLPVSGKTHILPKMTTKWQCVANNDAGNQRFDTKFYEYKEVTCTYGDTGATARILGVCIADGGQRFTDRDEIYLSDSSGLKLSIALWCE